GRLTVVHRDGVAAAEHADVDPDLLETVLAIFEGRAGAEPCARDPARVSHVADEQLGHGTTITCRSCPRSPSSGLERWAAGSRGGCSTRVTTSSFGTGRRRRPKASRVSPPRQRTRRATPR